MFTSSNEESPVQTSDQHFQHPSTPASGPPHGRAEPPSPVQHHMNYHHTSTPSTDDSFQDTIAEDEDFPTVPLDDNIWLEDPVPDRHLCSVFMFLEFILHISFVDLFPLFLKLAFASRACLLHLVST